MNNTVIYRKKLQAANNQINRTKKSVQRHFDSPDSEIHGKIFHESFFSIQFCLVARLINDVGQLSGCKPLQVIKILFKNAFKNKNF